LFRSLVVARPARWISAGAGKAAAREKNSICAEDAGNGFVIFNTVTVLHFEAGAAVRIDCRGRDVGRAGIEGLAVVSLKAANGRLQSRIRTSNVALDDQCLQLRFQPCGSSRVRKIDRASCSFS